MSTRAQAFLVIVFLLIVAAVVIAAVYPQVALNPLGTDAIAFGKVRVVGAPDEAWINLRPQPIAPLAPADGTFWIEHHSPVHRICFRAGGTDFCADATAIP